MKTIERLLLTIMALFACGALMYGAQLTVLLWPSLCNYLMNMTVIQCVQGIATCMCACLVTAGIFFGIPQE